jgi:hypothetical protein
MTTFERSPTYALAKKQILLFLETHAPKVGFIACILTLPLWWLGGMLGWGR